MEVTSVLAEGVKRTGFELITKPELNIVAFRSHKIPVEEIARHLKEKGWAVSLASYPRSIRIIVMPHIKLEHIETFIEDLNQI